VAETYVIETAALTKRYPDTEALRGLDLRVPAGSICGFLGRNGAGKTTTIKVLLGMARATSGDARVFGLPAGAPAASVDIRRRVGFAGEDKGLPDYMTVDEVVRFTAHFYPRWRADLEARYLQKFDLPRGRRVKALSKGMRTKLALLLALCRGAELLVLDEPTSGLDPVMTEEVLQALVSHVGSGDLTIFFSSHQITEIEQIADHVAIIDRGRTVANAPLDTLREQYRRVQLVFDGDAPGATFRSSGIVSQRRKGRVLTVLSSEGADAIAAEAQALGPVSIDVTPVTLKEIFLESVGGEN
jgi:ABC-2 type transport system ATP-binding protein